MAWNLSFLKKRNDDLETLRDITDDVLESEFVPYTCHYNPHTILTKNGELLQTIKVVGFSYENIGSEKLDLRETIRRALLESIPGNEYAIWFHTIRRKQDLSPGGFYKEPFARYVNERWAQQNRWSKKFTNEVYITVVREGQSADVRSPKDFLRGLWPRAEIRYREEYFEKIEPELSGVVEKMLSILEPFGAKRLEVVERDGVFYSEPAEFLGKLINLVDDEMPLPDIDLSCYLTTQEITFGFNAMEVRSHQGKRRFGAIMTIKDYKELSAAALDKFLQLPVEFIVSQCVDFINYKQALEDYQYQKELIELSGDKHLAKISGLDDIMGSDRGSQIDYGEQQLSVFLLADDLRALEQYVANAVSTMSNLGIIGVREDLRFEECYWAQLPGNFEFVKRLKPINTTRVGGFANLSNFPAGKRAGNHWGDAVSVFYTAAKTPYFFNFHVEDNGHTLVLGPGESGRTVLVNFLLTQARKFNPRLVFFDAYRTSEIFLRALGGTYAVLSPVSSGGLQLNPLRLPDSEKNRAFLGAWTATLAMDGEDPPQPEEMVALRKAVDAVYDLPEGERCLTALSEQLRAAGQDALAARLAPWHGDGMRAGLFGHTEDALDMKQPAIGFEMGELLEEGTALLPVFFYLLHRFTISLDGAPAMLVLKEAWALLDNPLLAPRLGGWLDMLRRQNALAVLTADDIDDVASSGITEVLVAKMATQIYLPDEDPIEEYKDLFGLSESEFAFLRFMDETQRHFLLKRGSETIVAELNLSGMEDVLSVLSSVPENIERAREIIAQSGKDPAAWLPVFFEREAL